jgi:hypothetical protein
LGLLVLGCIAACWWAAVGQAGATRSTCSSAHVRTILRSSGVLVYSQAGGAIFGCIESSGTTKKLSPIRPGNRPPYLLGKPFAANAPWVVGVSRHSRAGERFGPPESFAVTARNIALGDVTATCRVLNGGRRIYPTTVDKIVISRNGYFAWTGTEQIDLESGPVLWPTVHVCIPGDQTLGEVDIGAGIRIESLALRGKTLEWEDAGARCTAVLKKPIHTIGASVSGCRPFESS